MTDQPYPHAHRVFDSGLVAHRVLRRTLGSIADECTLTSIRIDARGLWWQATHPRGGQITVLLTPGSGQLTARCYRRPARTALGHALGRLHPHDATDRLLGLR